MKRRGFIKTTSLFGIALAILPQWSFIQDQISTEELLGKGNPNLYGDDYKLRYKAHLAFLEMRKDALKEGISIQVVSSYRSFKHQKNIWERKYKRYRNQGLSEENSIKKIIEYSTIPGTSRHHWGTDIDIVDGNVHPPKNMLRADHFHRDGEYVYLRKWLELNASQYGYFLVYTNNSNRKGFKYEPWHYSYKPLSKHYLKKIQSLNLKETLRNENFSGINYFNEAFIESYMAENILDINPELL